MAGGRDSKCKDCVKKASKKRHERLMSTPEGVEAERTRTRHRYHRLGYRGKHKTSVEVRERYNERYPETKLAKQASQHTPCPKGLQRHHWSYNEEHWKDVIVLPVALHKKLHRFIVYVKEKRMFKIVDGDLLDTREKHEKFIEIVKGYPS